MPDKEREAFERWATERFKQFSQPVARDFLHGGHYVLGSIDRAWETWQARAALAAAPADRVPIPTDADQAAGMVLVGTAWLKEHAPERLKAPAEQAPVALTWSAEMPPEVAAWLSANPPKELRPATAYAPMPMGAIQDLIDDADLDWHNGWSVANEEGEATNRYLDLARAVEAEVLRRLGGNAELTGQPKAGPVE